MVIGGTIWNDAIQNERPKRGGEMSGSFWWREDLVGRKISFAVCRHSQPVEILGTKLKLSRQRALGLELRGFALAGDLKFWPDVPQTIAEDDDFFLPVDAVIMAIFKRLDPAQKWNFDNINSALKAKYTGQQIEVWDDLWFWGFITQSGSGENREFKWNGNKYWALKESDKNENAIKDIQRKAEEFLKILTPQG